jgi:O-methyltransferase
MGKRTQLPDALENYLLRMVPTEIPQASQLREITAAMPEASLQIGADQAAFSALLIRLMGAKRALEIGTFTGYSALAVASALPEDGRLVCCDINDEWTTIARDFWTRAGVADRIDLRLGPALDTLQNMLSNGEAESFDYAFIDADKTSYDAYYEACLKLVRPGGLIALDNMLWHGQVADPADKQPQTELIRALNEKIRDDSRVDACLLSLGDGVMLARKHDE